MAPNEDPVPPRPRPSRVSDYAAVLAEQLRQSGMSEQQVRVVVADVLDHVEVTREDPVTSFGQPADYAAQWARPIGPGRIALRILGGTLGSAGILAAVYGVLGGGEWTASTGIRTADAFTVGMVAVGIAVLPWTFDLWASRRAARRFGVGGEVPTGVWRLVVSVAVVGGWFWLGHRFGWVSSDATLFAAPRWAVVVGGAVVAPLLFLVREPRTPSVPRPPGHPTGWWDRFRVDVLGDPPRR